MIVETNLRNVEIQELPAAARLAEALEFDGIAQSEVWIDPFVALAVAARETHRIRLATGVAIAFARSPMVVAYASRNLQELSGDRFALGIGTQVKGHILRRFSAGWGSPGPRLREYVLSLRAIWDAWQHGRPLDFRGDYYTFTLMTPEFDLGPTSYPPIKLQLAAVNQYNLRLAGELCDGLRVHSFSTPAYLRDVIWPGIRRGAARAGRSLRDFRVIGGGFVAVGADETAVAAAREEVRERIAFYASTRTYLPVLEHHGWGALNAALRQLISEERWGEMASLVSDEMLDTFCVSGTYATLAEGIRRRLGGLSDGIGFPLPPDAGAVPDAVREAVRQIKSIPGAEQERRVRPGEEERDEPEG
jgi:probable F420-dependent oxidoreductase